MELTPNNSFTPPPEGSSGNGYGGILLALGITAIGVGILYIIHRKYQDRPNE